MVGETINSVAEERSRVKQTPSGKSIYGSHRKWRTTDLGTEGRGVQEKRRCKKLEGQSEQPLGGHSKHLGLDPESTWKPVKGFHWKSDGIKS